jgi:hypothetical protein
LNIQQLQIPELAVWQQNNEHWQYHTPLQKLNGVLCPFLWRIVSLQVNECGYRYCWVTKSASQGHDPDVMNNSGERKIFEIIMLLNGAVAICCDSPVCWVVVKSNEKSWGSERPLA